MTHEGIFIRKTICAYRTNVRFLVAVASRVIVQCRQRSKRRLAPITLVRFVTTVDFHVILE